MESWWILLHILQEEKERIKCSCIGEYNLSLLYINISGCSLEVVTLTKENISSGDLNESIGMESQQVALLVREDADYN